MKIVGIKRKKKGKTVYFLGEERKIASWDYTSQPAGRSFYDVTCPFCGKIKTCYVWGFASTGAKCSCGARHCIWGYSTKSVGKEVSVDVFEKALRGELKDFPQEC